MNHFDVDAYTKEVLKDFTIDPNKDAWTTISGKLKSATRRKKRIQRVKIMTAVGVVIFISALPLNPYGFYNPFTTNTLAFNCNSTNKVNNGSIVVTNNTLSTQVVKNKANSTSLPKNKTLKVFLKKEHKENDLLWDKFQENTLKKDTSANRIVSITERSEVDSLLTLAQQRIIEKEQLHLQENRKMIAYEMLSDLDKETLTEKENNFLKNIKHSYSKIKTILSN
ncbi:hypothetical protein NBT05_07305 [Aquimarina sp. ERC-38]|uniref:hypothetical protein n=1 Tax=Aquimarina sp. ERC-38 TaxID=2949996 RepID=UPI002245F577|nr:hypothetical protein [Aquimarina sp. ERC-38]UZO82275.1 hypothetical protein NBT05_07305 [Aquimarina sp. ERC-38]